MTNLPENSDKPQWISVDERLPEDDEIVVAIAKGEGVMYPIIATFREIERGWNLGSEVLAWMPIPLHCPSEDEIVAALPELPEDV